MARVLLIDRDRLTRELLSQFLRRSGHEVIAIETTALPVGAGPEPEAIVIHAGESRQGAAWCRELRAQAGAGSVGVVLMIDWVTPTIEEEMRRAGADAVFPRLIKLEELLEALRRMT